MNLSDINPPTQMENLHFLNRTERLIFLKKHERSIVNKLSDNDPVQAAFSYLDAVTGIPDNDLFVFVQSHDQCSMYLRSIVCISFDYI